MEEKYLQMPLEDKLQLLGRMKEDCRYYLGEGRKQVSHLWSKSVNAQIHDMEDLLKSIEKEDRPDWLTFHDIKNFSEQMDHRLVINAQTLGVTARMVDIMKTKSKNRPGEVFFSIKRRVYGEKDGKKVFHFAPSGHGYMTVTPEMQAIFDTLFKDCPKNRSVEFIEWEDSWNVVFHDGIYISSRMCRMERAEFAEWYRTIQPCEDGLSTTT